MHLYLFTELLSFDHGPSRQRASCYKRTLSNGSILGLKSAVNTLVPKAFLSPLPWLNDAINGIGPWPAPQPHCACIRWTRPYPCPSVTIATNAYLCTSLAQRSSAASETLLLSSPDNSIINSRRIHIPACAGVILFRVPD